MKKQLLSLTFTTFLCCQIPVQAQQMLGISTGNYAGTHGLYLNPSYAADTRHGFYLNLFSVDAYVSNNYANWAGPGTLSKFIAQGDEFKDEHLSERFNGKAKLINSGIDFRGPSFLLKLDSKSGIALTTRARGSVQMFNVSENVAKIITSGLDNPDLPSQFNAGNSFSINSNVFSEVGLSYGRTVWEQGEHFLKAGVTVKKLTGLYSMHAINDGLNFRVVRDANLDYALEAQDLSLKFGSSVSDYTNIEDNISLRNSFGKGWGLDIGATYEHRKNVSDYTYTMNGVQSLDNLKSKYDYKIGVSLLDVGGLKYTNPDAVSYDIKRSSVRIDEDGFSEITEILNVQNSEKKNFTKAGLPTAFNANLDYKLTNKVYANVNWMHSLRGKEAIGMRQFSSFAITPRLEMKWLELAFPVSLMDNYSNLALGAAIKMGAFYVGSDNLAGITGIGKVYGANVYAGLSVPIFKGKKKDRDNDGVSNSKDKCKKVPGTWEKRGCPEESEPAEIN